MAEKKGWFSRAKEWVGGKVDAVKTRAVETKDGVVNAVRAGAKSFINGVYHRPLDGAREVSRGLYYSTAQIPYGVRTAWNNMRNFAPLRAIGSIAVSPWRAVRGLAITAGLATLTAAGSLDDLALGIQYEQGARLGLQDPNASVHTRLNDKDPGGRIINGGHGLPFPSEITPFTKHAKLEKGSHHVPFNSTRVESIWTPWKSGI